MDAAACADARAVERGGSASEVEPLLQGPALQKRVDKAGVEEVAGAGGVDGVHMKRGSVVELRAVPGEYAVDAECGGGEAAAEATMDGGEGLLQIVGRHKLAGNITAADQIVDIFKQRFDAGIEFIQVGDDRNFGGARPSGGLGGSRGVVAVKVKCARVDDPIALQFFRAKGEAVVAYEKQVPTDGGYVLLSAGSVKKMTAEEFAAAPKAGKQ